ncbi:hypothetical protein WJX72_002497 [[Myrmecia] bisecta]|uniref:Lariat debranching enzyme C-terminal domain-containing protein n=1 Tax=[Myrmecia] bisecta TaxID=41462 RepID=A0AAW1PN76_9CHLO
MAGVPERKRGLRVAVEGCCHGELDKIYETMQALERKQNIKIDLLICCGDFQAVRNLDDLECLACPRKYRTLATFWKYYTNRAVAPYPTLFIGGNHEAANYLWELYHGGWVAPNIWYMGHAGVINFGGVRIGGLSGIYNSKHYRMGYYEHPPYTPDSIRSAYHIRELEVYRLLQLKQPLDICLSHDWPRGIAHYGFKDQLFRKKPFLRDEVESNTLGSPPAEQLLKALRPAYWFSAHLHVKYAALYPHDTPSTAQQRQHSAGAASASQANGSEALGVQHSKSGFTSFLALDKCLPNRAFLQVVEFPDADGPLEFAYDEEWLGILRTTHSLTSLTRRQAPLPGMGGWREGATAADKQFIRDALDAREEIDLAEAEDDPDEICIPETDGADAAAADDVDESPTDEIADDPMFTPMEINNSFHPGAAAAALDARDEGRGSQGLSSQQPAQPRGLSAALAAIMPKADGHSK